jgi:hypothetical protein
MAAASTARRTAALAAVVFMAVAVVAATDNRLSAPLDCYVRDELETSSHGELAPISRTGKLGNSLRPFIVKLNHFRGGDHCRLIMTRFCFLFSSATEFCVEVGATPKPLAPLRTAAGSVSVFPCRCLLGADRLLPWQNNPWRCQGIRI